MKALFEIFPESIMGSESELFCEIGESLITLTVKDVSKDHFSGIGVYQLEKSGLLETKEIETVLNLPVLQHSFSQVHIICACTESVFVPFSLYNKNEVNECINLIHGDLHSGEKNRSDIINEDGVYNIFRAQPAFEQFIDRFPQSRITHLYTRLLRQLPRSKSQIFLILYPSNFVLVMMNEGKCDFINRFIYNKLEDVTYYLLNVCDQYGNRHVPIILSGLIDEDSGLYKEIYKYFSDISFAKIPESCTLSSDIGNLPAHYFSHNFALYLCE